MKKVFIGVLAALMLFAFTACEQQMPTYREVSYITISQTGDFVTGQAFDASKFQVNVYGTDGNVTTLEGNGLVTPVMATDDPTEWTYEVKATVATKEAKYTVTPYTIEGYQVNGLPSLEVYKSKSGIVVAATAAGTYTIDVNAVYDGGKTMPFASQKVELEATDLVIDELSIKETSVTVGTVYDVYANSVKVATATGVAAPTAAEFDHYEFEITSTESALVKGAYTWTLKAVATDDSVLETWTDENYSGDFTVVSYDDGDDDNKTSLTAMPTESTLYDQTVVMYEKANWKRGEVELVFPAGSNYVTTAPTASDVSFAEGLTLEEAQDGISPSEIQIKMTRKVNEAGSGKDEYFDAGSYEFLSSTVTTDKKWSAEIAIEYVGEDGPVQTIITVKDKSFSALK